MPATNLMDVFPQAVIDHGALRDNLAVARRHARDSRVWAVIKANAYGHGMEQVAASLAPCLPTNSPLPLSTGSSWRCTGPGRSHSW